MVEKFAKFVPNIFVVIWIAIIFSETWRYNPEYGQSVRFFQYMDLLVVFLLIGLVLNQLLLKNRKRVARFITGSVVFGGLLVLDIIALIFFSGKSSFVNLEMKGMLLHLGHVIGVAAAIFSVYLCARVTGRFITFIVPLKIPKNDLPVVQTAVGIMTVTFLLFFLGILGLLINWVVVSILLLLLLIDWRGTLEIIYKTLFQPLKITSKLNALGMISFLFLGAFLIFDFVQILRPFPAGTDSINLYVNLPNIIGDSGSLVKGYQPYNWSLFMSLGTVVFDRIDVTLALSFLGGVLSISALYQLSRKWLDINQSALCLLLFGSLPMTNFFWYHDMKPDMGLLFIALTVLLLFYHWATSINKEKNVLQSTKKSGKKKRKASTLSKNKLLLPVKFFFANRIPPVFKSNRLLVIMGLLSGFALGVKLTFLFFLFALGNAIWYTKGGFLAFMAAFFLSFGMVFLLQLDAQPQLRHFHPAVAILQWVVLAIGVALLVFLLVKRQKKAIHIFRITTVLAMFFALPILPWLGKNYMDTGELTTVALLNGTKSDSKPTTKKSPKSKKNKKQNKDIIIIPGIYTMPETKIRDQPKKKQLKDGVKVDLHRFMGFEEVLPRYLSLPYDIFQRTNVTSAMNTVGFLMLLLFPIIFLFPKEPNRRHLFTKFSIIILCLLMLAISIPSAFLNKHQLSHIEEGILHLNNNPTPGTLGSFSDGVNEFMLRLYQPFYHFFTSNSHTANMLTYPILLGLFLFLIYLIRERIQGVSTVSKAFIFLLAIYFFLWWILGSGGVWYGMLLFCVPFIFLIKGMWFPSGNFSFERAHELYGKPGLLAIGCFVWLFLAFSFRTTNYHPVNKDRAKNIYVPAFINFQMGHLSEAELLDNTFANATKFKQIINERTDGMVYRVGTEMNFFIEQNDRRVVTDTFLDFFEKLVKKHKNKNKIIQSLKAKGFEFIVFDLNLSINDQTAEQLLTKKFTNFLNTLYNNPQVELVLTDRTLQLGATGEIVYGVFPDVGTISKPGRLAVFRIK